MSHSEYYEWFIKIGCGWLGWPPNVVNESHICEIITAYEGLIEKLKACYGSGEEKNNKEQLDASELDADSFDRLFERARKH